MTGLALYPELARDQLEMQYHATIAALWQAAEEALGAADREACQRQIEVWLVATEQKAATSAMVRIQNNRCLEMARAMAGPVH